MGWWSIEGTPANRRSELIRQYTKEGYIIIGAKTVGRATYLAVENKGESYVTVFIYEKRDSLWFEKSISEDAGPCEVGCPLCLLEKTKGLGHYSQEWRQNVRAYHEKIAKTKRLKIGDVVEVYGKPYTVSRKIGRTWIGTDPTGKSWRLPTKNIDIKEKL